MWKRNVSKRTVVEERASSGRPIIGIRTHVYKIDLVHSIRASGLRSVTAGEDKRQLVINALRNVTQAIMHASGWRR
jgi:hypothetical protein